MPFTVAFFRRWRLARALWRADRARREDRPADAKPELIEAVERCRASGRREELALVLKKLGQIERDLQHGDVAIRLYEEAAAIYRTTGDALKLAHTIRHIGDIHQDAGRGDLAAPWYDEALALYRQSGPTRTGDLANAIRSVAVHKEGLWEEARDLYASLDSRYARGVDEASTRLGRLGPSV